jgi:sterol desaturase/sphingolipid hydroxylase (fatty acid hydroxylase superfamily)
MTEFLLEYEPAIRLGFFFGVFGVMALWETLRPCRLLTQSRARRWLNNLALAALNSLLLRLLFPAAAVGMAALAVESGWGLFNQLAWPLWLALPLAVVLLDMGIYLQHVMFHAVPLLWRLHRVHHADLDFDVTTGARFHPIEIILSLLIKFAMILVLGPPVAAVVVFEVLLNTVAMFNHGNVRLPASLDRVVRLLVVTPDMHRVHHSIAPHEANSNFGFNLSVWDRLFGTYRPQPEAGHQGMTIGLDRIREPGLCVWLPGLLRLPFIGKAGSYVINRRWGD